MLRPHRRTRPVPGVGDRWVISPFPPSSGIGGVGREGIGGNSDKSLLTSLLFKPLDDEELPDIEELAIKLASLAMA